MQQRGILRRVSSPLFLAVCVGLFISAPGAAQELPPDDFQISWMVTPPNHPAKNHGRTADIAFNAADGEFFVVWEGEVGLSEPYETEIFGRRISAATGQTLGSQIRISHMGPDGDSDYSVGSPSVAYVARDNRYFVVWTAENNTDGQVQGEFEIFGQFVDGGADDLWGSRIRISYQGSAGNPSWDAFSPDVAYSASDFYLFVVWSGDDTTSGHHEIFGQQISPTGVMYIPPVKISDMAAVGDMGHDADNPAVARSECSTPPDCHSGWLVVWEGDDSSQTSDLEYEIFAQMVNDSNSLVQGDDVRISHVGTDGDANRDAHDAQVTFNDADHEFLIVWSGNHTMDAVNEIQGARLEWVSPGPGWKPSSQFTISDMGSGSSPNYVADHPAITYDGWRNGYFVTWAGLDDRPDQALYEFEIFARHLDGLGTPVGSSTRVSTSGPAMDPDYDAWRPTHAFNYNEFNREYLVVWQSLERKYDSGGDFFYDDHEIFGQRLDGGIFFDGFESGDTSAWSSTVP